MKLHGSIPPPMLIFIDISKKAKDTMIRKLVAVLLLLLATMGRDAHASARRPACVKSINANLI